MSANLSRALAVPMPCPEPVSDTETTPLPGSRAAAARKDHFVQRDGREFAGAHLIVDFWGARHLDDLERMEAALREAVDAGGATLLHIHLHHFTENGGISGVAVLAESHISVHTWPERDFAAFDVFMCGDAEPARSVAALQRIFKPQSIATRTCLRGAVAGDE